MVEQLEAPVRGYSALPGILRELIRTPDFKEMLQIHLRDINPDNAAELVRVFLWEDPGFSLGMMAALPEILNWLVEALATLGTEFEKIPTLMLQNFLEQLGAGIDLEHLKKLPAAYAPMLDRLIWEDPDVATKIVLFLGGVAGGLLKTMGGTLDKVGKTVDFGKVRVALTDHFDSQRAALHEKEWEIFNPIPLANLLGIAAPGLNYLLTILARALAGLNLPAEVLANAVFQVLEDIDPVELGGFLDSLSGFINTLHAGNLVLGRDEPRFKEVLDRVADKLLANMDGAQFKRSMIALGEDGAVIGKVLSDRFFATPESTAKFAHAVSVIINHGLRMAATGAGKFSELPDATLAGMAENLSREFEARELGRLANSLVVLANRMSEQKPDLVGDLLGKILATVEPEEFAKVAKTVAIQGKDAVLADAALSAKLQPESIAGTINAGLAALNRYSALKPAVLATGLSAGMGAIDTDELSRAVGNLVNPLVDAAVANPKVLMAVVKPCVKGGFRFVKGSVANVVRKLRRNG